MSEDKSLPIKKLTRLIKDITAAYLIQERGKNLHASTLTDQQWQTIELADIPPRHPLSRIILLIPNSKTVFRQQQFSIDLVAEKDLQEAVNLNIESWSPYPKNSPYFSITKKNKGHWHVAIWIWKQSDQDLFTSKQPTLEYTHIMPELAWHCARVTGNESTVLVTQTDQNPPIYIYLDEDTIPKYLSQPKNTAEASRFWRGLGVDASKIKRIFLSDQQITKDLSGLPSQLEKVVLKKPLARANWLRRAQIKGRHDWINPSNWIIPICLLLSLVIVWAVTDALLIKQRNKQIDHLISQTKQNYQKVINQQEKIEQSLIQLTHYAKRKEQQQQIERILAELSTRIPNDIWLDSIQLESRWLDIRGRGKDVVRLLALLESLENAHDIVLLNDIRTDRQTGDEQFQIRLILTKAG